MNSQFKEQAIPLVLYNSESQLYDLNQDAMDFIKQIPAPIGVITVAGLYRTGKSYLLNRMLLNKSSGFGVGPTVNACTKGLWVWGSPLKGQTAEGDMINILIVDSEGIGSLNEDSTHDTRVFSLAILLGSQFIYNSVGSIDENAIQNLSLVVNLTKHIHVRSNNEEADSEDYSPYFPSFYWVIRDFSLQLVDQENEQITSKEYLENSLQQQKGFSDEVEQKNRIRRLLTSFFKERECITLVRPVVNEDHLQKLDQMDLEQLRPEFFEQVMNLRKRILTKCKPKVINGKYLNGEMFVSLTRSYLTAINDGAVPNIENAWSYLCKNECHKAEQMAYDFYEKSIKENIFPRIPTSSDELKSLNKQIKEQAIELFKKKSVGEVQEEYLQCLKKSIKHKFNIIIQQNEKESYNQCNGFIQREFNPIERKLKMNEYEFFSDYEKDLGLFYAFLLDHGPKGHNRKYIFADFIRQALSEGANFFINRISNELDVQSTFASEMLKKSEFEIKELKDESQKEKQWILKKVQDLERQKIEQNMNLQKNQELINEVNNQKQQIEQELQGSITRERSDFNQQIQQLKAKMSEIDEQLQESEREKIVILSNFKKQKALLEHKAQHFENLVEEYSKKEKKFDHSIMNTKSELNSQLKQMQQSYEKTIKELQTQLHEIYEKHNDAAEKLEEKSKHVESVNEQIVKTKEKHQNIQQENQGIIQALKKELQKLRLNERQQSQNVENDLQQKLQNLQQENESLTQRLKNNSDSQKTSLQESKKNEALLEQKVHFLQSQCDDLKQQMLDMKRQHDSTLDALEMSSQDQQAKQDNKQLIAMREQHMHDLKLVESDYQNQLVIANKQLEVMQKERGELEFNFKMAEQELKSEIGQLKERIVALNFEMGKKEKMIGEMEEEKKNIAKEVEKDIGAKMNDMEDYIQELKDQMQREHHEMAMKSEESLAQLKNFYELEKERIENRLLEEREKNSKNYNSVIEDYESRAREEQAQYEDEIESLKDEIQQYEMQTANISAQYDHDIDLRQKQIENLEKLLKEAKESLSGAQTHYNLQIEQQLQQFNSERKTLNDKLDQVSLDLQKKDKDYLTTLQKKEQAESTLARKEQQWVSLKQELVQEKNQINDKMEENRKMYGDLQNELLENKINYEKSIALSSQQNEFFSKKVEELEKQLELSSSRYEERIKQQKQEWMQELNEKLGKNQEDKMSIEVKYDNLKKQLKESQLQYSKAINELEKEKAVALEKLSNLDQKYKESEEKYTLEVQSLTKNIKLSQENNQQNKSQLQLEVEELKKQISHLEMERHELTSSAERDKALWENRVAFLEQQKDQAKQDLQENQKKFEQTLQHLNSKRQSDKSEQEQNVSERLNQLEKKYNQQIKDTIEQNSQKLQASNEKIKLLEQELKQFHDKIQLDSQSKSSSQVYTEKRLNELQEQEKKYQSEIEKLKSDREQRTLENQKQLDKLKDQTRQKLSELEEKVREAEKKRRDLMFDHEKERTRWSLEKDNLFSQKNDLQDALNKIEKKQELMTRENERLKNDSRGSKKGGYGGGINIGNSFQLNASRNMSSDRKSPINTRVGGGIPMNMFNRDRYSNNDYSMVNNSIDRGSNHSGLQRDSQEDIGKENFKFSVLQDLKEDGIQTQSTGFKSFQQKFQMDKTPDRNSSPKKQTLGQNNQ